ncbi:Imidazole glycerol phosphate synthase subunit HisF [Bacillus safensis subsp. safensis]
MLSRRLQAFTKGEADAALAASIFHYKETSIHEVKTYFREHGVKVRIERYESRSYEKTRRQGGGERWAPGTSSKT